MRRIAIGVLALLAASTAWSDKPDTDKASSAEDLWLRVSTHHGFRPLQVALKGELRGIDTSEYKACHVRVDWAYEGPSGITFNQRKDHPCVVGEGEEPVPSSFERKMTLDEPGEYILRIVLVPKEGRPLAGLTHEIQVFRSSLEVGIAVTRTDN
jgi:hypothetical protein